MIKKFLYFFNKNQKRSLLILFILMFISTILEMTGLGFIFSIVGVLSPNSQNNLFINKINEYLNIGQADIFSYLLM